jgi:hypothetical protein
LSASQQTILSTVQHKIFSTIQHKVLPILQEIKNKYFQSIILIIKESPQNMADKIIKTLLT